MKYILILFTSLLFLAEVNSQDLRGNSCIANLEVKFLDSKDAETVFKTHGSAKTYVNLVLMGCQVKYNGTRLSDIDDINEAVFNTTTLPATFDVLIGVKFDASAECLARLLCEINEISSHKVNETSIYFYKM